MKRTIKLETEKGTNKWDIILLILVLILLAFQIPKMLEKPYLWSVCLIIWLVAFLIRKQFEKRYNRNGNLESSTAIEITDGSLTLVRESGNSLTIPNLPNKDTILYQDIINIYYHDDAQEMQVLPINRWQVSDDADWQFLTGFLDGDGDGSTSTSQSNSTPRSKNLKGKKGSRVKTYYIMLGSAWGMTILFLLLTEGSLELLPVFPAKAFFPYASFVPLVVINSLLAAIGIFVPKITDKNHPLWVWGLCFIAIHLFAIICVIRWALAQSL